MAIPLPGSLSTPLTAADIARTQQAIDALLLELSARKEAVRPFLAMDLRDKIRLCILLNKRPDVNDSLNELLARVEEYYQRLH